MNLERSILIAFLGNYLINTVLAALVVLIPAGTATGYLSPQYITFVALALVVVALLAWWRGVRDIKAGAMFGLVGFLVSVLAVLVSGLAGVLGQTGSLSQTMGVLPNFWPFLASWSTLILFGYWMVPAIFVGWLKGQKKAAPAPMAQ